MTPFKTHGSYLGHCNDSHMTLCDSMGHTMGHMKFIWDNMESYLGHI